MCTVNDMRTIREGASHGFVEAARYQADLGEEIRTVRERVMTKALHECPGDRKGLGGHEAQPVCREPGCQHWDADDQAAAHAQRKSHSLEHLAVCQHVRTSQIDFAIAGYIHRPYQRGDGVAEFDRLATVADPARRHHDGEAPDQITHHLERRAPRANNDARTHVQCTAPTPEDVSDLAAAGQMLAQRGPLRIQPAEIDHVADTSRSRRTDKTLCVRAVASGEPSAAAHGMDQVEDRVDPDERCRVRSFVIEVEAPIFDALQTIERLGVTAKATDDVAGFHEAWDKLTSDKACGAGDADGSGSIALRIRHPGEPALIRRVGCSAAINRW